MTCWLKNNFVECVGFGGLSVFKFGILRDLLFAELAKDAKITLGATNQTLLDDLVLDRLFRVRLLQDLICR